MKESSTRLKIVQNLCLGIAVIPYNSRLKETFRKADISNQPQLDKIL